MKILKLFKVIVKDEMDKVEYSGTYNVESYRKFCGEDGGKISMDDWKISECYFSNSLGMCEYWINMMIEDIREGVIENISEDELVLVSVEVEVRGEIDEFSSEIVIDGKDIVRCDVVWEAKADRFI